MDIYKVSETSYNNGYKNGYEDGKKDATKPGYWITKDGITFCSECMTCGLPHWKRCPVCEAKMGWRK